MNVTTYEQWADHHMTVFALERDNDAAMLLAWIKAFKAAGFTPEELDEATSWMAANDAPKFRDGHLRALQSRVRDRRSSESSKRQPEDNRGTCADCGGTGRVIVPHPNPPNQRTWYTAAILCHCPLGHWFGDQQTGREQRQMTFLEYTRLRPGWRDEMKSHEDYLRQEANAEAMARYNDSAFGEIVRNAKTRTA